MLLHPHEQQYIFSNTPEEIEFQRFHIPEISVVQNHSAKRKIIVSVQKSWDEEFVFSPNSKIGWDRQHEFQWFFQEE